MNILLTGDKGFVGKALKSRLKDRGDVVTGMNRENGDITDLKSFDKIKPVDMIVHAASIVSSVEGLENPRETYNVNIMGTVNVFEFARKTRTPVILFSSCKVKPNSRGARGSYGVSKVCDELIALDYWKVYGVPYIAIRPASIYGPTQDGTEILGWMTWFVKAMAEGKPVNINGDDNIKRDSIHINDLVRLLLRMIDCFYEGANSTYEVGGGASGVVSLSELISLIESKFGRKFEAINYTHYRKADPVSLVMDNERVEKVWDWKPNIPVWDGIKDICDLYKK